VRGGVDVSPSELQLKDALLICRFGDHGLHTKRWSVIGTIPSWSNVPSLVGRFVGRHDDPSRCYVTEYDALLNAISEQVFPAAGGHGLPDDAQYGSDVVEAKLTTLLQ
jgi:hypothetical protein